MNPRKSVESAETGDRLRAIRNERGYTAREVALGMGLTSPEGYRQYEKGNIKNWSTAIPRLARGLRMDPAELARRLDVSLDPRLMDLEGKIQKVLGPERAPLLDAILDEVAELPPDMQDKALEMMMASARGIRAGLRVP